MDTGGNLGALSPLPEDYCGALSLFLHSSYRINLSIRLIIGTFCVIGASLKTNYIANTSFCTYLNTENKRKNYSKIKFGTGKLSAINDVIYQAFSLILLVLSRAVQDKITYCQLRH